jgi:hypothetical protein
MARYTLCPQLIAEISALVINAKGTRAIKDIDLATLLGIGLAELYSRVGDKLWCFTPTLYCMLSDRYDRGRLNPKQRLAFFRGGVVALAGMVNDDLSRQILLNVSYVLRNHRRASLKRRNARRAGGSHRSVRYYESMTRLLSAVGSTGVEAARRG